MSVIEIETKRTVGDVEVVNTIRVPAECTDTSTLAFIMNKLGMIAVQEVNALEEPQSNYDSRVDPQED